MRPTLQSLVAPEHVTMNINRATSNDKVGIMLILVSRNNAYE